MMTRILAILLPALMLALALGGARDAAAQAIPAIIAESWPVPIGGYATFRVRMANRADKVHGGTLNITYSIDCTQTQNNQSCPGTSARRAHTTIPCGQPEGGVIVANLNRAPYSNLAGPYRLTMTIQRIEFNGWSQDTINRVNQKNPRWSYEFNPNGTYERQREDSCSTGSYNPASETSGSGWTSSPVHVNN